MNEFMSDALDDFRDFAGFGCPFAPPAPMGPVVTDPEFVAIVTTCTMMIDAQLMQAFTTGFVQGRKQATETKPYVVAAGKRTKVRNALRHSLHQTGVR
jgi:hypothetical protein